MKPWHFSFELLYGARREWGLSERRREEGTALLIKSLWIRHGCLLRLVKLIFFLLLTFHQDEYASRYICNNQTQHFLRAFCETLVGFTHFDGISHTGPHRNRPVSFAVSSLSADGLSRPTQTFVLPKPSCRPLTPLAGFCVGVTLDWRSKTSRRNIRLRFTVFLMCSANPSILSSIRPTFIIYETLAPYVTNWCCK